MTLQGGGAFDRWHITSTDINEEQWVVQAHQDYVHVVR
jgi:hypothetical protein